MKNVKNWLAVGLSVFAINVHAAGADDPLLAKVMIDQLEVRDGDGTDPLVLEADAWIGYDLQKLWLKVDVEKVGGVIEESEFQALYSHAVDPYWDFQIGWKHNNKPKPSSDWLAVGVKGLAPYFIETDASLFFGDNSQIQARVSLEHELMFTQRLVLIPELGMNFYSKDDAEKEIGSGLSDASFGLRLAYEIKREFAPYIGINWTSKYGTTADYARESGEKVSDTQFVVGIKAWF